VSTLTIAVLGGLGAMVAWGLADFFGKLCIIEIGELPSLVWGHLVGSGLLGGVVLVRAVGHVHVTDGRMDGGVIALLILFGCLEAFVYLLLFRGLAVGQVSVLSPTFASFSGVVALVSILFLGERAGTMKVVALAATFFGIVLLSSSVLGGWRLRAFAEPGFFVVLAATLGAAGWTLGWDRLVRDRDPISFVFLMYAFMTLALGAVALQKRAPLWSLTRRVWPKLLVLGLGESIGYCSLSWAYSRTTLTSVVAVLSGAASLPAIGLSHVVLGERLGRYQLVGVLGVIAGISLLCFA
jgi:drug/metabolite transporter (DMT)-like permease